jgi:hypothetical protein
VSAPKIPTTKSGYLEKYSMGRSFLSGKNWKKRFFTADASGLTYYESKDGKQIGRIDIHEPKSRVVTYPSTKTHDRVQFFDRDLVVIFLENNKELRLLLRCATVAEHDDWAAVLGRLCPTVNAPQDAPAK